MESAALLIYLILDLEILLLYPYAASSYENGPYGLATVLIFTTLVTIGFVYELGKNVLKIESRQDSPKLRNKNNIVIGDASSDNSFNNTLKGKSNRMFSTFSKKEEQDVDFIPVITYSNADTSKTIILSDNKGKSGIYR
jgi:hypothetical protein